MTSKYLRSLPALVAGIATLALVSPALAAPDLICSVEATPNNVTGSVSFKITVENIGDETAVPQTASQGMIFAPDVTGPLTGFEPGFEAFVVGQIAPAEKKEIFPAEFDVLPGQYTARCEVNPDAGGFVYDEPDKSNNTGEEAYTVDEPPPMIPDLIVLDIIGTPNAVGDNIHCDDPSKACTDISVTVKNIGLAVADHPSLAVDIFVDLAVPPNYGDFPDGSAIFCSVGAIGVGEEQTVECNVPVQLSTGATSFVAFADYIEQVDEIDEDNNTLVGNIIAAGPPDLSVLSVDISQDTQAENYEVTYDIVVQNTGGSDATGAEVCVFWQEASEPQAGAVPDALQALDVAKGANVGLQVKQTFPIGGDWTLWIWIDCNTELDEIDEDNNKLSKAYSVEGPENEPPVLNGISGPAICKEGEHCVWTIDAVDNTLPPLTPTLTAAPLGM